MRKHKLSIKSCIFVVIVFIILGTIVLHYVPCYIWRHFSSYKKSEFFGSYLGSAISALLALGGVSISLIISDYQTHKAISNANYRAQKASDAADSRSQDASNKADDRTNKVLVKSRKNIQTEKIDNLEIEIMTINYKTLNRLITHTQELNVYFTRSYASAVNLKGWQPSNKALAAAFLHEPLSGDVLQRTILSEITKDIKIIIKAVNEYNIFNYVYASQIKNLFSSDKRLNKQYKDLCSHLNDLNHCVNNVNTNINNIVSTKMSPKSRNVDMGGIVSNIKRIMTLILPKIDDLSFEFGKFLKDNINNHNK